MSLKHCRPILKCGIGFVRVPLLAALALSFTSMLAQAQDEPGSLINPAIARDAVMDILPDVPKHAGLAHEDFIAGNDHTARQRQVTVRIGPDGHMIPSASWQENHPSQCRKQARETNSAAQRLTFEMERLTENVDGLTRHQYFAFVRLIDADTNIVKKIAEGGSTVGRVSAGRDGLMENPDAEGISQALSNAMQKLGLKIGTPTDGCGDIRLVHQFGNVVDEEFGFVAGYQNESAPNVTYEWDFGDGARTAPGDQVGRHVYREKGTYTVTVHVGGEDVREGRARIAVTVKEKEDEPIQPRDGIWTITMTGSEVQGCASTIASAVENTLSGMIDTENRHALNFRTPFHPEPLMKFAKKLAWEQTGPNTWTTVVAEQGGGGFNMKVVLNVEVVSPTLIKEVLDQHIDFQNSRCLATGDFDVTWGQ